MFKRQFSIPWQKWSVLFPNVAKFITLIFCDYFKDNPLLARVHSKTKLLSIVNISALLSASVGCFLSAFFSEWKLSAIALALLAVVFAAIGFGIEIFVMFRATADSQAGIGFWMTLVAILLLLVYIVVISIVFRRRRRTTWWCAGSGLKPWAYASRSHVPPLEQSMNPTASSTSITRGASFIRKV